MLRGAFNKFPDIFVQAFKIVVDSWKFSMLLLYISGFQSGRYELSEGRWRVNSRMGALKFWRGRWSNYSKIWRWCW